jgi:cell division protein FtsZ
VRVTVIAAGFDDTATGRARSGRPVAAYQPSQGSDAFGSPWRPVSLPGLKDNAVHAGPASPGPGASAPAGPAAAEIAAATENGRKAADPRPAPAAAADPVPAPRPAERPAAGGPDGGAEPARQSAAAADVRAERVGTKRKSVVFEEDDELDVPDFLK